MMQAAEHVVRDLDGPSQMISSGRFDIGAAVATGERQASVRRLVVLLGAVMVAADALFAA